MAFTIITSRQNPKLERWKKLQIDKKFRREEKSVLIEGKNLILDLMEASPKSVQHLIIREGTQSEFAYKKYPLSILPHSLFQEISSVEESCGIILEYAIPKSLPLSEWIEHRLKRPMRTLILDKLQDPGNIGTLIRTAVAFDIENIITIQPMCDLWNSKTLRSGKGAHFFIPLFESSWEEIQTLQKQGFFSNCIAAFPPGNGVEEISSYLRSQRPHLQEYTLILGNEANGITISEKELNVSRVTIPMSSQIDSLNVSQAGAILLYLLQENYKK